MITLEGIGDNRAQRFLDLGFLNQGFLNQELTADWIAESCQTKPCKYSCRSSLLNFSIAYLSITRGIFL